MESPRTRLLERLRHDAWRRGTFRLASGRESDFFIDCKQVILTAEGHRLVGEVLCEVIRARTGRSDERSAAGQHRLLRQQPRRQQQRGQRQQRRGAEGLEPLLENERVAAQEATLATMFACESITPFGRPPVPEV